MSHLASGNQDETKLWIYNMTDSLWSVVGPGMKDLHYVHSLFLHAEIPVEVDLSRIQPNGSVKVLWFHRNITSSISGLTHLVKSHGTQLMRVDITVHGSTEEAHQLQQAIRDADCFAAFLPILKSLCVDQRLASMIDDVGHISRYIVGNDKLSVSVRVEAATVLGLYYDCIGRIEDAGQVLREGIAIAQMSSWELECWYEKNPVIDCEYHLKRLEDPFDSQWGPLYEIRQSHPDHETIKNRIKIGGSCCDGCGKTLEELQMVKLKRCDRCYLAYYCSCRCQKRHWKATHNSCCRAPNDIRVGDIMLLRSIRQPDYHRKVVQVKDETRKNRFSVELLDDSARIISVKVTNLCHLRPEVTVCHKVDVEQQQQQQI